MNKRTASSFDLSRPGIRVSGIDRDWAHNTERVLSLIQDEFARAVACWSAYRPIRVNPLIGFDTNKHTKSLRMVYAREFVLALDSINKLLSVLPEPPETVIQLRTDYKRQFDEARNIRDSFAHIEDRGRGRGKGGKPISSPLVVLACFVGDRFVFSASDGKQYGIEISDRSLALAQELVQDIIGCYKWE